MECLNRYLPKKKYAMENAREGTLERIKNKRNSGAFSRLQAQNGNPNFSISFEKDKQSVENVIGNGQRVGIMGQLVCGHCPRIDNGLIILGPIAFTDAISL